MNVEDYVRELMSRPLPAYVDISGDKTFVRASDFLKLLETICALLVSAELGLKADIRNLSAVVYVDYGASEELQEFMSAEEIEEKEIERVLLYLVEGREFLDTSGEIYARKISIPRSVGSTCEVTFACFRDKESLANDWEYNVGLYVVLACGTESTRLS